ncbi:MAG: paraquat-inducible protein A, partial [Motiliproteus sp.]
MKITAEKRNLMECHECGTVHQLLPFLAQGAVCCSTCQHRLDHYKSGWLSKSMAFTLTGLILFVLSNVFPFMALELGAFKQQTTLLSGVGLLLENHQYPLALLVFGTIFLFPLLELSCLAYVLIPLAIKVRMPGYRRALVWLLKVSKWNMMEVFLLAVLVSAVKLQDMADIVPGVALFTYFALVLILLLAKSQLNHRQLWDYYDQHDCFPGQDNEVLIGCSHCQALVAQSVVDAGSSCPRCHQPVAHRTHRSLQKTAALLLAAVVLYIPANTLPIMITTTLGQTQSDTIISGVLYLLHGDTWPLAVIVFVASVLVPISKISILAYLWWSVFRQSTRNPMQRIKLYRLTELVGHWSMVDVYVVILMAAHI